MMYVGQKIFLENFSEIWVFINKIYNMKKVVKLSESDLTKIIHKILNEQTTNTNNASSSNVGNTRCPSLDSKFHKACNGKCSGSLQEIKTYLLNGKITDIAFINDVKSGGPWYVVLRSDGRGCVLTATELLSL